MMLYAFGSKKIEDVDSAFTTIGQAWDTTEVMPQGESPLGLFPEPGPVLHLKINSWEYLKVAPISCTLAYLINLT